MRSTASALREEAGAFRQQAEDATKRADELSKRAEDAEVGLKCVEAELNTMIDKTYLVSEICLKY